MFIIAITNPDTLGTVEELDALLQAAFPPGNLIDPRGYSPDNFSKVIESPNNILLVAGEENPVTGTSTLSALALLTLPEEDDPTPPQVAHFFNTGSPILKNKLVDKVVEVVKARGYMSFRAINATGRADSVWARTFKRAGEASRIGSIMEFTLE